IVNRPCQLIRLRDDDRARRHALAGLWVLPSVIETSEAEHAPVRSHDVIGLPAVWPLEPFVIATCRDHAPIALEGVAEHRLVGDALRTCVEARRQLLQRLFPPPWNEAPAH